MRNTGHYKNKAVLVVGLARSGLSCANLLYDLGADVSITDNKDDGQTQMNAKRLKSKTIALELGRHTQGFIRGKDLVVISPGVPPDSAAVIWAKRFKIPIISEIELAWDLCCGRVIAVTGSNGKSTVTTLIGKVLEAAGRKQFICGNIGNPFSAEVNKIKEDDFVSLEVSSFQLERIARFKPHIALLLNFSRNHLDRYEDLEEYLAAKKRIFKNQDKSDFLVLNQDDAVVRGLAREANAKVVYFSQSAGLNPNQAAVIAVASVLGIEERVALEVFRGFKGLQHRLEVISNIDGIQFINDSKATTADSTLWALRNILSPVILIAGGRDKGVDYSIILSEAKKKAKEIILIGEAKERIKTAVKGTLPFEEANSLEEAVQKAYSKAKAGDCVLLSPMCSSFDMFSNYEERGEAFKKAVFSLSNKRATVVEPKFFLSPFLKRY